MRKARKDSVLKARAEQSEEFGQKVYEWCTTPASEECVGGQAYALQQLAADGIKTSPASLSEFFSWWKLRMEFRRASSKSEDFEDLLRKEFPEANAEKIAGMGQLHFTMLASNVGDAKEFREMEYLRLAKSTAETKARQKDADLKLAERRVSVMEKKIADAQKTLGDTRLDDAAKAQRLREIFKKS